MCADQIIEVGERGRGDDDASHADLQVGQVDDIARLELLLRRSKSLCEARDAFEDLGDVVGIGIGVIDGRRQQRPCQRPVGHVRACRQPPELGGPVLVERHVQSLAHGAMLHRHARLV